MIFFSYPVSLFWLDKPISVVRVLFVGYVVFLGCGNKYMYVL